MKRKKTVKKTVEKAVKKTVKKTVRKTVKKNARKAGKLRTMYYVGLNKAQGYVAFGCPYIPTNASHGARYAQVYGPFPTKKSAAYFATHRGCGTVQNAIAKSRSV